MNMSNKSFASLALALRETPTAPGHHSGTTSISNGINVYMDGSNANGLINLESSCRARFAGSM
jgi:hypothetical protein